MQRPAPSPPPPQPLAASHAPSAAPAPAPPLAASRSAPSSPPDPSATPASLWAATQARLADRPSFVFLRHLRLVRLDGEIATVVIAPGQREVQHVATPQRLEVIAQVLGELRGRRTRIDLQAQAGAAPAPTFDEPDTAGASEPPQPGRPSQLDRRAALQLPLVRAALQAFPDALLIDAREEGEPDPAAPAEDAALPPAAPAPGAADPTDPDPDPDFDEDN